LWSLAAQLDVQILSSILSQNNRLGQNWQIQPLNMSLRDKGILVISHVTISDWAETLLESKKKIHTKRCPCEGRTQALGVIFAKFIDLNHFWNFFYFHVFFKKSPKKLQKSKMTF